MQVHRRRKTSVVGVCHPSRVASPDLRRRDFRTFREPRSKNVPAVYPTSAKVAFLAVLPKRRINKLRSKKHERRFDSRRLHHEGSVRRQPRGPGSETPRVSFDSL